MFLSYIKLENFRNFEEKEFFFDQSNILIKGDNGRGKSNLLEAIHLLSIAKSPHGSNDLEMVRHGQTFFEINATIGKGKRPASLSVRYDPNGKKVRVNGNPLERPSMLVGLFNSVAFFPEDVDLTFRSPLGRRRMLDILVSQAFPSYLSDLQIFRRILTQRNSYLKSNQGRSVKSELLEIWDDQFSETGIRIIKKRAETMDRIVAQASEFYSILSSSKEALTMTYFPTAEVTDNHSDMKETFLDRLKSQWEQDLRFGYTSVGPHRENISVLIDGLDAQKFASSGQLKGALLAWKLAEVSFLVDTTGDQPVLLFDDLFSEFDYKRASSVLKLIESFGQTLITSARDPDLPLKENRFTEILIEGNSHATQ